MDAFTNPSPPHALPATVSRVVFAELCARLPPPPVDTPEARAESDAVAMDAAAALHPADAFEAKLAAQIVAADAQVADCQRLAVQHRNDLAVTFRCRAQATSAMREMRALLRDYRRMQAERDKALNEMHPAAMERAGYWFREATAPEPAPEPAPAEPARPDRTRRGREICRHLPRSCRAHPGEPRPAGQARLRPARAGDSRRPGQRHQPHPARTRSAPGGRRRISSFVSQSKP